MMKHRIIRIMGRIVVTAWVVFYVGGSCYLLPSMLGYIISRDADAMQGKWWLAGLVLVPFGGLVLVVVCYECVKDRALWRDMIRGVWDFLRDFMRPSNWWC